MIVLLMLWLFFPALLTANEPSLPELKAELKKQQQIVGQLQKSLAALQFQQQQISTKNVIERKLLLTALQEQKQNNSTALMMEQYIYSISALLVIVVIFSWFVFKQRQQQFHLPIMPENQPDSEFDLSLAYAYVELGDKTNAKQALKRVLTNGTNQQQIDAKQLKKSL